MCYHCWCCSSAGPEVVHAAQVLLVRPLASHVRDICLIYCSCCEYCDVCCVCCWLLLIVALFSCYVRLFWTNRLPRPRSARSRSSSAARSRGAPRAHVYVYIYIYIYIYICIYTEREREGHIGVYYVYVPSPRKLRKIYAAASQRTRAYKHHRGVFTSQRWQNVRPISLLRLSPLINTCWLETSGKLPTDIRIPPLKLKIPLESRPPKSRTLVRRLAASTNDALRQSRASPHAWLIDKYIDR